MQIPCGQSPRSSYDVHWNLSGLTEVLGSNFQLFAWKPIAVIPISIFPALDESGDHLQYAAWQFELRITASREVVEFITESRIEGQDAQRCPLVLQDLDRDFYYKPKCNVNVRPTNCQSRKVQLKQFHKVISIFMESRAPSWRALHSSDSD